MSRIHILNTSIDNFSMNETLSFVQEAIATKQQIHHVVVNAGKVVQMQKDLQLRESVNSSDIINADGQAVVWAAKFLNKPLMERVAGIDLMQNLVKLAASNKYKIYFLGAEENVVSKTVAHYSKEFGQEIIAGYRNGYYQPEDEKEVIEDIVSSKANILFVAITSPKKENFLYKYKNELASVNFIMGVGGSFDVIAGKTKRAPLWMQDIGLEWFYRFLQEPKRMWKRYLIGNSKFILLVLKEKLRAT
jgi:N-acetylglucosaminyldiphosphoundecaprenol N-acetyl-beta-D-mannosaminyltransferase